VKRPSLLALVLTGAAVFSPAWAAPFAVTDGWFRALPGKLPAGGYFTVRNNSDHDVAITGARSDACGMLMIHQSSNTGGMSGMDMVAKINVPAGGKVAFAPGGYHLMCSDPTPAMKIGARIPVLLNLSDGTALAVAFSVRGPRGK
jgi:copper(I)-binding protein